MEAKATRSRLMFVSDEDERNALRIRTNTQDDYPRRTSSPRWRGSGAGGPRPDSVGCDDFIGIAAFARAIHLCVIVGRAGLPTSRRRARLSADPLCDARWACAGVRPKSAGSSRVLGKYHPTAMLDVLSAGCWRRISCVSYRWPGQLGTQTATPPPRRYTEARLGPRSRNSCSRHDHEPSISAPYDGRCASPSPAALLPCCS